MWRYNSVHEKSETELLDVAMKRIDNDVLLYEKAESILDRVSLSEPLILDTLNTPQDIRYHGEGPFVRDHLRKMLMVLYAISEEKLHLIDIEEFRRMKGYYGEIEEMEEIIKEKIALFETFILCHDAAKWASITFNAPDMSLGAEKGFQMKLTYDSVKDHEARIQLRNKYIKLFNEFSLTESEDDRSKQKKFFYKYQIEVHYHNHGKLIYSPVYNALLSRLTEFYGLSNRDHSILEDLISHHIEFASDFIKVKPSKIGKYIHIAQSKKYDADDFIDLLQAAIFIDMVCGSLRYNGKDFYHDSSLVVNSFISEHDFLPDRRMEVEKNKELNKKKRIGRLFREFGLDGRGLMSVLNMQPGPEFGAVLKNIHSGILGEAKMPTFSKDIDKEIAKRSGEFYKKIFRKGE